jgi:hypothetical protein
MRPVPPWLWVITITYAVLLILVIKTGVWRKENAWAWGGRYFPKAGGVGQFMAVGFLIAAAWLLVVFTPRHAATGDPRHVGGYGPAEQKDLIN